MLANAVQRGPVCPAMQSEFASVCLHSQRGASSVNCAPSALIRHARSRPAACPRCDHLQCWSAHAGADLWMAHHQLCCAPTSGHGPSRGPVLCRLTGVTGHRTLQCNLDSEWQSCSCQGCCPCLYNALHARQGESVRLCLDLISRCSMCAPLTVMSFAVPLRLCGGTCLAFVGC